VGLSLFFVSDGSCVTKPPTRIRITSVAHKISHELLSCLSASGGIMPPSVQRVLVLITSEASSFARFAPCALVSSPLDSSVSL
jgi:hypothetical protein